MESTGKVTPHKVAPSEPTIDTTLITIAIAGNNENRNTANACVATTNKIAVKFNGQKPLCENHRNLGTSSHGAIRHKLTSYRRIHKSAIWGVKTSK